MKAPIINQIYLHPKSGLKYRVLDIVKGREGQYIVKAEFLVWPYKNKPLGDTIMWRDKTIELVND